MSGLAVWTEALNLQGFEVVEAEVVSAVGKEEGKLRLTVLSRLPGAVCPQCGAVCDEVHQTRDREGIRDLPVADRAVELRVRVAQFFCAICDRAFTPAIPGLAEGTHATERFLGRAAELIRHGDMANAAKYLRTPERTLHDWYYAWVARQQIATPALPIKKIGIDELSLKKSTDNSSR